MSSLPYLLGGITCGALANRLRSRSGQQARRPPSAPVDLVVALGADLFDLSIPLLLSTSRSKWTVRGRQAIMSALQAHGLGTQEIGRALNRDHSTVTHGVRRANQRAREDEKYAALLQELTLRAAPVLAPRKKWGRRNSVQLDPVMDPAYNLREVYKQCILLEDHLVNPRKRCQDCISKHSHAIEALIEEARGLDKKRQFDALTTQLHRAIRRVQADLVKGKCPSRVAQDVRALRKQLNPLVRLAPPGRGRIPAGGLRTLTLVRPDGLLSEH